ncbi:extensin-2 [Folsomia candida]|uniref:Eukaryotic translation initiation factor 4 gamma 1 n=1 Tax=Folsomia candida TaxID=158441 RepID=A0A226E299_FOLCA|nr:extensin-2 [Folsomia candida]OXA51862.1 Eukaryotic translation initiation factor 4 gamma 1 [Folsomia candida]
MNLVVVFALLGQILLSQGHYAPYPPSYYRTGFQPGSTGVFPSPSTVNIPQGTLVRYPAGANVVYNAPTRITYPQETRCYYPSGPATYPSNTTVSYPAGAGAVYPPGTELIMLDNTTNSYQPINNSPYGIVNYPTATNCTYYNNPGPPAYYPSGTPVSTYYVPGGSTQYGPSPPPVGFTQYFYNPYNQPQYRTVVAYNGGTGYPMWQTGPYYGPFPG